jgi:hypothetical protein
MLRGRVSIYVTNGSKTASSTVQLHDSLGSTRAYACTEDGFSSQNGDRARGAYTTKEQRSVVSFCGQKDWMQKIFIKKLFLFTVRSVYCAKQFITGSKISLKDVRKSQMMADQVAMFRLWQGNSAVGGRVDWSWQEDNGRQCSNYTRKFAWFSIEHNAWSGCIWQKWPGQLAREVLLHHDNARPHAAPVTQERIRLTGRAWPLVTSICLVR